MKKKTLTHMVTCLHLTVLIGLRLFWNSILILIIEFYLFAATFFARSEFLLMKYCVIDTWEHWEQKSNVASREKCRLVENRLEYQVNLEFVDEPAGMFSDPRNPNLLFKIFLNNKTCASIRIFFLV